MVSSDSWGSAVLARLALLTLVATAPLLGQAPAGLSLDALACPRPSAGELAAAAELAAARSVLASTGGVFAEGWTVGAAAGPHRVDGASGRESQTDVAMEASAPLLAGSEARDRLADALASAEAVLPAAARIANRAELATLYTDAWAAERVEELRSLSLAAADEWLATARRRAAEGADAPYQAELVAVERREAAIALAAARAVRRTAWSALAVRCDLPPEPQALAFPPIPSVAEADTLRARVAGSASLRAVALRAELDRAGVALETARRRSRWLLRGEAAQEGDEDLARVGVAYRIPRSGENAALDARRESELARITREAELEAAALTARFDAAVALQAAISGGELAIGQDSAASIASIRTALEALVREGRARASEILPLRRQLLFAEIADVERAAAFARAAAEIRLLTDEVQP